MKLFLENQTKFDALSNQISFSDNPFQIDNGLDDPIFQEVQGALQSVESQGALPFMENTSLDDLKLENVLTPTEMKQWEQLPTVEKERILENVYQSDEYRDLQEVLADYQAEAAGAYQSGASFFQQDPTEDRNVGREVSQRDSSGRSAQSESFYYYPIQKKEDTSASVADKLKEEIKEASSIQEESGRKVDASERTVYRGTTETPSENQTAPRPLSQNRTSRARDAGTAAGQGQRRSSGQRRTDPKSDKGTAGKGSSKGKARGGAIRTKGIAVVGRFAQEFRRETIGVGQDNSSETKAKTVTGRVSSAVSLVGQLMVKIVAALSPMLLGILAIALVALCLIIPILTALFGSQNNVADNPGVMPYYAQADYPTQPFNGDTIASDGCGITSMAMVASLLRSETITPVDLANMANVDAKYNTVTSHDAINEFASYFQLGNVEEMGGPNRNCCGNPVFDLEYIKQRIQENSPIVLSVTGGYYNPSGGGHYIALYGSGTHGVFVYDPGSRAKYKASLENDGSDWDEVFANAKHIWIFEPYTAPDYINMTDGTYASLAYVYLKQAGFSDAAASGVLGNMFKESSAGASDLRPQTEAKDGSIGLLQWTGGRKERLIALAANRGAEWTDINVQLEFLMQEINDGSQWKWTSYAARHYPAEYDIAIEDYKRLSDPQLAAEIFCAKFVRPNYEMADLPYRRQIAQQIFDRMTM